MTVTEYREKHPDCEYCVHNNHVFDTCFATNLRKSKNRAKKCPCYKALPWEYEEAVKAVADGEG